MLNMLNKRPRFLDPKADVVFKKIFGHHPDITRSFLNSILPLPEGRLIESVKYISPEQSPRIPEMKNTIVDVKCTDQSGRIFIVEMQMSWSPSFMKRFLFGTSKAYVQQLEAGKTYSTLCPVYGLALVNRRFEDETDDWFHHYKLTNVKDIDKILEGLEMIFLELPKFKPETFVDRKMGVLWLRFLRELQDMEAVPEEFMGNPELIKAIELAEESAYTTAELNTYDRYLDAVRVEQSIKYDSFEQGIAEGIAMSKADIDTAQIEAEQAKTEAAQAKTEAAQAKTEAAQAKTEAAQAKTEAAQAKIEAKIAVARNMLSLSISKDLIAQATGLSVDEID